MINEKEIANLLGVVFFLQYVADTVPPTSLGIAKISKRQQIKIQFAFAKSR